MCFCVLLHGRNDNPATSFSNAVSFSTCLKSILLHTSLSANTNLQEPCLPVSCHNHQTTHEGLFPVHGVFIWPSKHSPVAGSFLGKVSQVTKRQREICNEENYTVFFCLNLVGRSGVYYSYAEQQGNDIFFAVANGEFITLEVQEGKTSDKSLFKHLYLTV